MSNQIAVTIFNQLKAGNAPGCASGIQAMGCWGFNTPINTGNGLSFNVMGRNLKGSVNVEYNAGTDLYDVNFMNRRGAFVAVLEGVYCDQLTSTIDSIVESGK